MATSDTLARPALRALLAAVVVLAAVVPAVLIPTAAHAEEKIGISARPTNAAGEEEPRTRFSYAADPGQRVDDFFLVSNTGSALQSFTVYGTDAFNDDRGDFALLATDQPAQDIGSWVRFENGESRILFDLGPGERRVLPFTLQLPDNAGPGDHVGGLVASVLTPGAEVNVDRRVATRLYARVSGELQARLDISSIQTQYLGEWWNPFTGEVRLTYTVSNGGNVALASNYTVGAKTWFGIAAGADAGGSIQELLPGNSHSYEASVPGVAAWLYLNPWVKLNPFVDDPDPARQLPVGATTRDAVLLAVPWIFAIALLLIVGFFVYREWRRRVDAKRAEEWIAYTEAEAKRKAEAELETVGAGQDRT